MKRLLILLVACMVSATPALAHEYMQGNIHIMKPWSRPLPAVSPNGAAYMKLTNKGEVTDRLVSVSTPAAKTAELHNHIMVDGVMKMRPVENIEVKPGESATLQPGGLHVMLMGLTEPLEEGKSYPLTLTFEKAGSVEVKVMIFEPTESGHGDMKHDMKHDMKKQGG